MTTPLTPDPRLSAPLTPFPVCPLAIDVPNVLQRLEAGQQRIETALFIGDGGPSALAVLHAHQRILSLLILIVLAAFAAVLPRILTIRKPPPAPAELAAAAINP